MVRDLYRSRPHLGLIYVAMKSLRSPKLLWWKLPADPADIPLLAFSCCNRSSSTSSFAAVPSPRKAMRRRDFIAGIVGSAAAWPLAAQAQKIPRIGVLLVNSAEPMGPFQESLRELGYVEGKTIQLESLSAEGRMARLPELAAALVNSKVDVIVAVLTPAVSAAKNATRDIPIVMGPAGDPLATGLVASLARPGGNVTGVSATAAETGAKNLELIRDAFPSVTRVAVLAHATDQFTRGFVEGLEHGAQLLRMALHIHMVRGAGDLEPAFAAMVQEQAQAVIFQGSVTTREAIELALKHKLPALSAVKTAAEAGALMSFSASYVERARMIAAYVDKILKGARPADLPVQQPTRYEISINLKTAKALGLTIPPTLLGRADEVIE
ncbi:MAG TPA: ABC transporter substrate-binding protein [Bradyrhizobium sp.]|nr:ABC transporter substrate-binding protein [Bradyrhizobium sp.]